MFTLGSHQNSQLAWLNATLIQSALNARKIIGNYQKLNRNKVLQQLIHSVASTKLITMGDLTQIFPISNEYLQVDLGLFVSVLLANDLRNSF